VRIYRWESRFRATAGRLSESSALIAAKSPRAKPARGPQPSSEIRQEMIDFIGGLY
jgi:hypothetical protein